MHRFLSYLAFWMVFAAIAVDVSAQGAPVQWASTVEAVSSEYPDKHHPGQFAAREALGPPSVLPAVGQNPCAWAPAASSSIRGEVLILGYKTPQHVRQIAIAESFNPGAIFRVILVDTNGDPHRVYENPLLTPLPEKGRLWNLFIEPTRYKVRYVRLELKTSAIPGFNQIDAVGLSDSRDSVKAQIHLAPNMEFTGKRQNLGAMVNSSADELCPLISPDGRTLYFTRAGHPQNIGDIEAQDIWYSEVRKDGSYTKAQNVKAPLNTAHNNSICSVTPDGQTVLLLNRYNPDGSLDATG
ncbi:MAG: hypothetical protein AAF570_16940, partial [Bacteroidota bacterium]